LDVLDLAAEKRMGDQAYSIGKEIGESAGFSRCCSLIFCLLIEEVTRMMRRRSIASWLILFALGVGHVPQTVPAPLPVQSGFPAQNVELVGRALGGFAQGIAVQGNYAYLATAFGLMIFDVTTPTLPIPIARLYLPDLPESVTVSGHLAYVAAESAGLRIIDVSDPTRPVERGFFDTPDRALDVAVSGTLAFVADGRAGLFILRYVGASGLSSPPSNVHHVAAERSP